MADLICRAERRVLYLKLAIRILEFRHALFLLLEKCLAHLPRNPDGSRSHSVADNRLDLIKFLDALVEAVLEVLVLTPELTLDRLDPVLELAHDRLDGPNSSQEVLAEPRQHGGYRLERWKGTAADEAVVVGPICAAETGEACPEDEKETIPLVELFLERCFKFGEPLLVLALGSFELLDPELGRRHGAVDVLLCLLVGFELVLRVAVRLLFFREGVPKSTGFERVALEKFVALLDEMILLVERGPSGVKLTAGGVEIVLKLGDVL